MVEILAERYRLDERVDTGGVSAVWRAFDLNLNREVAIKTLDFTVQHDDPEALARFHREAIATAGLNHPNIVVVYDTGIDKNLAYLVMELLTGPTLRELLTRPGSLQFEESLVLAKSVADGLAAAHAIGIVHRDIKPSNIMLHHCIAKIVDFGIAHLEQESNAGLTLPAMTLGTPAYIAPEQAMGAVVTSASDIYSFGCLMMALFAGRPPFRCDQPLELTQMQVSDVPPRLIDLRPDAPPTLDELVAQMLAKDPTGRPDAETISIELGRLLASPQLPTALLVPVIGGLVETDTLQLPTTPTANNLSKTTQPFAADDEEEDEERSKFPTWLIGLVVLALLASVFAGVSFWLSASSKPNNSSRAQGGYSTHIWSPSPSQTSASTPSPSSSASTEESAAKPADESNPIAQPTRQPLTPTKPAAPATSATAVRPTQSTTQITKPPTTKPTSSSSAPTDSTAPTKPAPTTYPTYGKDSPI